MRKKDETHLFDVFKHSNIELKRLMDFIKALAKKCVRNWTKNFLICFKYRIFEQSIKVGKFECVCMCVCV